MSDISNFFDAYLLGHDLGEIFAAAETIEAKSNIACQAIMNAAWELMIESPDFGRKIQKEYYRLHEGEATSE